MLKEERTTLYFKSGNSDKVYTAEIAASNSGFLVNFAYGRRGGTLNTGTKTKNAVSIEEARKIYTKLVKSKTSKGYQDGDAGISYVGAETETERDSGVKVQLLNAVGEAELENLFSDENVGMQEKYDGHRRVIKFSTDAAAGEKSVAGINRRGLVCGIPAVISDAVKEIAATSGATDFIIDGEQVGETLIAFDLIGLNGVDLSQLPYTKRYEQLANLNLSRSKSIRLAPLATSANHKRKTYERVKTENGEGVVFKNLGASYTADRPNSGGDQLKFKFQADATCEVSGHNGSRRSISITVREAAESNNPIAVGNCTIPPNKKIPAVGSLVDIQYLYAYRNGSLFQPVYKHQRNDKSVADLHDTLKFKADSKI